MRVLSNKTPITQPVWMIGTVTEKVEQIPRADYAAQLEARVNNLILTTVFKRLLVFKEPFILKR
jgi:hypothetical protein